MRLLSLLLILSAVGAAQPASVRGVALDKLSGKPLSGVHVRLVAVEFEGFGKTYGALSGHAGEFSIEAISPGSYIFLPEYRGYVYQQPEESAFQSTFIPYVQLNAGEHRLDVRLYMVPRAVIMGRVLDQHADPVANVRVSVESASHNALVGLSVYARNLITDASGVFRYSGAPGKYYLRAVLQDFGPGDPPEVRTDGTSAEIYDSTYYPSTVDKGAAVPVNATSGNDVNGIEIRLVRVNAVTLNGQLTGFLSGQLPVVSLWKEGSPGSGSFTVIKGSSQHTGYDGRFKVGQLRPGLYRVFARLDSGQRSLYGQADVRLDGDSELILGLSPGKEVIGTLEVEGVMASRLKVHLVPTDDGGGIVSGSSATVDERLAFKLRDVPPGRFRVVVEPLSENAFVKRVLMNGVVAKDNIVEVGHTSGSIRITVSPNGARLSGTVRNKSGDPLRTGPIYVLLAGDSERVNEHSEPSVARVTDGRYWFGGVAPGKYRIVAFDRLQFAMRGDGEDWKEAVEQLVIAGQDIDIKEGDITVKDLIAVGKKDLDRDSK